MLYALHVRARRDLGGAIIAARFFLRDLPISIDDDDALPSRSSWFPMFLGTHGQDVGTLVSTCGIDYPLGADSGGTLML